MHNEDISRMANNPLPTFLDYYTLKLLPDES